MTEPQYEFVKGQGWILVTRPDDGYHCTIQGKDYVIIARKPKSGEFGCFSSKHNPFYVKSGSPIFESWLQYFTMNGIPFVDAEYMRNADRGGTAVWVTVVPK